MLTEPWRITLLGGLAAQHRERVVTRFQTYKTGALLAYLACRLPRAASRETLVEWIRLGCPPRKEFGARQTAGKANGRK